MLPLILVMLLDSAPIVRVHDLQRADNKIGNTRYFNYAATASVSNPIIVVSRKVQRVLN